MSVSGDSVGASLLLIRFLPQLAGTLECCHSPCRKDGIPEGIRIPAFPFPVVFHTGFADAGSQGSVSEFQGDPDQFKMAANDPTPRQVFSCDDADGTYPQPNTIGQLGKPVYNPAPGETRAQANEHDIVTGLEHPFLHQLIQGDGNRGAGGVSIPLNVIKDPVFREVHALPEGFIDS